jgi:hypothetical protein
MAKKKRDGIPLEIVREFSIDDGRPAIVTYRRRGFLMDVNVTPMGYDLHKPIFRLDGKEILQRLAEGLRRDLDAKDLPTDKSLIPIELDFGYNPEQDGVVAHEDIWFECAEESTEPLTKDRLAAELLHAINRLGRFDEDELRDVFRAMRLYHLYSVGDEINDLAVSGQASRTARAKGPPIKNQRARAQRKSIMAIAESFWERHPEFKGRAEITAMRIFGAVNQARNLECAGCKPLAERTIANHIRAAMAEKN